MKTLFFLLIFLISSNIFAQHKLLPDSLISPNYAIIEVDSSIWAALFKNNSRTNLNENELHKVDSILNICILENNNNGKGPGIIGRHIGNNNFVRQYIPAINEKGEKIVYVNCLCYSYVINIKKPTKKEVRKCKKLGTQPKQEVVSINYRWRKKLVIVADGGGCFFNVKINLSTLSYFDLYVNGI